MVAQTLVPGRVVVKQIQGFAVVDSVTRKEVTRINLPALGPGKVVVLEGDNASHGMAVTSDGKVLVVCSRLKHSPLPGSLVSPILRVMDTKELIRKEIENLPELLQREVYDFARFLRLKSDEESLNGLLLSESALRTDWDTPEEDAAWANL